MAQLAVAAGTLIANQADQLFGTAASAFGYGADVDGRGIGAYSAELRWRIICDAFRN